MTNVWLNLKDLVATYVFAGDLSTAGQWGELCADLVATAGSLFLIALPFVVVLKVIRIVTGG